MKLKKNELIGICLIGIFSFVNIFLTSSTYVLLILLLLTSAIIGIIPIVNLLRKTPSEIVAKYDI